MSIDKRPNGQWRARVREYPGGPERAKHFKRKVDAERWEAETRVQLARGSYITPQQQRVTLGQYIETYLGRQVWRSRTLELARRALTRAEAHFGAGRPIVAIRRGDVESFVATLSTEMAASTVKVTFQHFRSLMRTALADGLIVVDPTYRVRLPNPPSSELIVPSPEQVHALINAAAPDFRAAIVLGAHVGLRAGEAQGLFVSDVDFLRRTVNVRRQLDGRSTVMALGDVKTGASNRAVPVPSMVLEVLSEHIRQFGEGRDGVLLHRDREYLSDNQFNWAWRGAQRRAGIPEGSMRFHWLRHAYASSLISAGCSVKAVADAMGHNSPAITLKTYASLWPGDDDRIRAAVEAAWMRPAAASDSRHLGS